jgi:ATP-dependent HslUV protease ATP-binding subunit HslU
VSTPEPALPAGSDKAVNLDEMNPRQIVAALDKYVVGQHKAKRAVAIALRNRVRRQKLPADLAEEVAPKNIILIGPTGVGKTEIARRLARLSRSPFLKVEASKFTEVGYVGRDVESMIRDLVEIAVDMVREELTREVADKARANAEEKVLDLLLPPLARPLQSREHNPGDWSAYDNFIKTREKMRDKLRSGEFDHRPVEIEVQESRFPSLEIISSAGVEDVGINMKDMLGNIFGSQKKRRSVRVDEAMEHFVKEEEGHLIDADRAARDAIRRVEHSGMIFLDEIDKIAGRERGGVGPDVSREGVQRDILPIVEGTTVHTKYGMVRTDHILFIAAGAFHVSSPSDLIPELQGRFPLRVEMDSLTEEDFVRILTEPESALIKQYRALMETEGVELEFAPEAIRRVAHYAAKVNESSLNIGARRLYTIMETVLDEIMFEGADLADKHVTVTADYVERTLLNIVQNEDLSKYIL